MDKHVDASEHILVCISPSPSNPKVIAEAVKMSEAFHATLTAIYVKPTNYDALPESNKARLQNNIKYAEQCGASITTMIGDDVPVQVAEYAHISDTTKIVVGRSGARRRHADHSSSGHHASRSGRHDLSPRGRRRPGQRN